MEYALHQALIPCVSVSKHPAGTGCVVAWSFFPTVRRAWGRASVHSDVTFSGVDTVDSSCVSYTYICTYIHYITLHYIAFTFAFTLHYINYIHTFNYIHYITLHYITLHYITSYNIHYITFHSIPLHSIPYHTIHTYMILYSCYYCMQSKIVNWFIERN